MGKKVKIIVRLHPNAAFQKQEIHFTENILDKIQAWKLTGLSSEYDKPKRKGGKHGHRRTTQSQNP